MINTDKLAIRTTPGGTIIAVKVVPGSSRDKISGALGDELKVTTAAPPEKGKANAAVVRIIAAAIGVSPKAVQLVSGPTSARKEFRVCGLSEAAVRERLAALP